MISLSFNPFKILFFNSLDLVSNFPYCLPNDSRYVSLDNLVLDQ